MEGGTDGKAKFVPNLSKSDNTQPNTREEEARKEIWRNIGRVVSARPETRTFLASRSVPSTPVANLNAGKTKVGVLGETEIFLEDLLTWETNHWVDTHSEVYGFPSQKPPKKPCRDMEVQTMKMQTRDVNLGGVDAVDVKVQTEFDYEPEVESTIGRTLLGKPYPPSLFAFISKIGEKMISEVRTNIEVPRDVPKRNKDQFYEKRSLPQEREDKFERLRTMSSTLVHRLRTKNLPEGDPIEALCVSWSPTGRQVAVGHGVFHHFGFCRHHSIPLTIWALVGSLLKQGALHEIRFDGCITSVQFHPKHGNFLAFGFQSGEVGVMNLNGDEEQPIYDILNPEHFEKHDDSEKFEFKQGSIFVNTNSSAHAMSVTAIQWLHLNPEDLKTLARKNQNSTPYMLVTTSLDGYMVLWSVDKSGRLTLERRYAILTRDIPNSYKKQNMSNFMYIKEIGIQTWDSFKTDPTKFVCSTYGSYLFTGNLLSTIKYNEDELCNPRSSVSDIFDPEPIFIKQEIDYIRCIACNPYNPYLYVYGTQFGNLFIRNTKFNTGEDILKTYLPTRGTFDVGWSIRPMVFGVINDKQVLIYDLTLHERVETLTLDHEVSLRSIDWNKNEFSLLAITDSEGYVNIWKLPPEIINENFQVEIEELNTYAEFTEYTAPLMTDVPLVTQYDKVECDPYVIDENSEEFQLLEELTRNHFPVLNTKFRDGEFGISSSSGAEDDDEPSNSEN